VEFEGREFKRVLVPEALEALEERALDSRPSLVSPFAGLNESLYRGGFHRGELAVLGGRMHTRKTAVAINLMLGFLDRGVPVGFLSLDESLPMYTAKFLSAFSGRSAESIETTWMDKGTKALRSAFNKKYGQLLTLADGVRPTYNALSQWLQDAEFDSTRPQVMVVDYISLLVHYRMKESERIPRLMEEMQVFTHDKELFTVALHQAGRTDEGVSKRNHGDKPGTAEALLYGGEQQADIILNTYRPALNQLGNMSMDMAIMILGKDFDEDEWKDATSRVRKYQNSTFVQLLKNRPGTKLDFEGVELVSDADSQRMHEKGEATNDEGEWA
jgi:KaiC/GvpD/RAD55 family RecA-like ATPase